MKDGQKKNVFVPHGANQTHFGPKSDLSESGDLIYYLTGFPTSYVSDLYNLINGFHLAGFDMNCSTMKRVKYSYTSEYSLDRGWM